MLLAVVMCIYRKYRIIIVYIQFVNVETVSIPKTYRQYS